MGLKRLTGEGPAGGAHLHGAVETDEEDWPERAAAVPIRCPWPFVLVAVPWTRLGRRSLRAGFFDYQTWVCIALLLLRL